MTGQKWLDKAGGVAMAMCEAGFTSVFEQLRPNAYGTNTAYTLWIRMDEGLEVLTIVDGNGHASAHRLTPISLAAITLPTPDTASQPDKGSRTGG